MLSDWLNSFVCIVKFYKEKLYPPKLSLSVSSRPQLVCHRVTPYSKFGNNRLISWLLENARRFYCLNWFWNCIHLGQVRILSHALDLLVCIWRSIGLLISPKHSQTKITTKPKSTTPISIIINPESFINTTTIIRQLHHKTQNL